MKDVVAMMREMSLQTDPQALVEKYRQRVRKLLPYDATLAISRRGLEAPWVRVTRDSRWSESINPWTQKDRLPLLNSGILSELIYGDEPRLIEDLRVGRDDPAHDMLDGFGSLFAIPQYDQGIAKNMVVALKLERAGLDRSQLATIIWTTGLFGRATGHLVLSSELKAAYEALDRELRVVSDLQRSLLPPALPEVAGLEVAAHYQTSRHAGGDYYDFFPLQDGRMGILVADVSGHGAPATVLMAVTHTIAHARNATPQAPSDLLAHLNENLVEAYRRAGAGFVTAFYGILNPTSGDIVYAAAGHPPARIRRNGSGVIEVLDGARGLPLGIDESARYPATGGRLDPRDALVLYTDGVPEARDRGGQLFGYSRLDDSIRDSGQSAEALKEDVLRNVDRFADGQAPDDDRTLVVARSTRGV